MEFIYHSIVLPFSSFISPMQRIFGPYLAMALLMAFVAHLRRKGKPKEFFKENFKKSIFWSLSSRVDYAFFFVNSILMFFVFLPQISKVPQLTRDFIVHTLGFHHELSNSWPLWAMLLFSTTIILAMDLGLFIAHWLQHKVSFLWEFHKVHHSAENLNPFTVFRVHPVDIILNIAVSGTLVGIVEGTAQAFFSGITPVKIMGTNIWLVVFYFFGYNLRHSEFWLDYPSLFKKFLISPAQHQIHHSKAHEHYDKNFGFIFSFWDRSIGSLVDPTKKLELKYGIHNNDTYFSNPLKLYLSPFILCFHHPKNRIFGFVILIFLLIVAAYSLPSKNVTASAQDDRELSVFLEDLTTQEVMAGLANNVNRIIIPTGGVEQNGQHMILGKHGYIVKETAKRIALRLGKTLVSPVISFVPEGAIDPPTGHMLFPGTLTVSESTYEALLEDTARSLIAHGFKTIIFLGDSKHNQAGQAAVAQRLNQEFEAKGVKVMNIDEYYTKNGQTEWLISQGFTKEQVGFHAGIKDTSELLYMYPSGVRKNVSDKDLSKEGVDGRPDLASADIGKMMIELKVNAALKQIRQP